jgi:hypothetical protein
MIALFQIIYIVEHKRTTTSMETATGAGESNARAEPMGELGKSARQENGLTSSYDVEKLEVC